MFTNRTFGIEIEAYGVDREMVVAALQSAGISASAEYYNHSTRPHWKVITDSSIQGERGFELVSPILSGEEGLRQIETVCDVLVQLRAKINKSCGLHVHHGAADLSIKAWKDLTRIYTKHERGLDSIMPESRRGNNNIFCRSLVNRHRTVSGAWAAVANCRSFSAINEGLTGSYRYFKLNLDSFARHGTVEFRHHSGTVEAEKIINWVKLTQAIVERAHQGNKTGLFLERNQRDQGGTLEGLFNAVRAHVELEVIEFYRKRAKFFQDKVRAQRAA